MRASFNEAKHEYLLCVTAGELSAINNALNEVCNGIDIEDGEFQTRLGVTRGQLQSLLAQVNAARGNVAGEADV
jgi:hypothetical protein